MAAGTDNGNRIEREMALVTVRYGGRATLDDVWTVARRHGARIVDAISGAATVETAGAPSVVEACAAALAEFGECEVARSAALAVPRLSAELVGATNTESAAAGREAWRVG